MSMRKKFFKTGHVYAGPEPNDKAKREEYLMEDVYAGPEQMEKMLKRNISPEQDPSDRAFMGTVYAGPEYWGGKPLSIAELQVNGLGYPLNNIPQGDAQFNMIYAAPDAGGTLGIPKNLSTNRTPESTSPSNEADVETTVCASCGERVRRGKFCEYCGMVLK